MEELLFILTNIRISFIHKFDILLLWLNNNGMKTIIQPIGNTNFDIWPYLEKSMSILSDIRFFVMYQCTFQHLLLPFTNTITGMKITARWIIKSNVHVLMYESANVFKTVLLAILVCCVTAWWKKVGKAYIYS